MRIKFSWLIFAVLFFVQESVIAQDGGVSSIFHRGVGARQTALGGAVAAYPQDPTTIYWNPAGLEYLSEKSISLYYTSFIEGTSYQFVGFAYPTLYIGTFGVGAVRIATDGIIEQGTSYSQNGLGVLSYSQSQFYLSYAKIVRNTLSVGVNVKLQQQLLGGFSDTGFGVDFSLMYLPEFDIDLLRNIRFGLNVQNAFSPKLNPGEATDKIPVRMLLGLAKPFYLGFDRNPLVFLLSIDQNKNQSIGFHTGLEYTFQEKGMVRMGADNNGFAFGAGTVYKRFQFDYAFGQFAESEFGSGHKLSFTYNFGKTREELLEIAERERRLEIQSQADLAMERERSANIFRLLDEGRRLYNNGDWSGASIKFSQVLGLDSLNIEAEEMFSESENRIQEQRQKEFNDRIRGITEARVQSERQKSLAIVDSLDKQGSELLRAGNYNAAIDIWERALQEQPESQSIKDRIESARSELNNQIARLIQNADNLGRQGNFAQAIAELNNAQLLSRGDDDVFQDITNRINVLEARLRLSDFYQQGLLAYQAEDWQTAFDNFQKASRINPNYLRLSYFYVEAERRVKARDEIMTPEMQAKYSEGFRLFINQKPQEAIDIWTELLKEQPFNKQIIEAIDDANKEIERQKSINR